MKTTNTNSSSKESLKKSKLNKKKDKKKLKDISKHIQTKAQKNKTDTKLVYEKDNNKQTLLHSQQTNTIKNNQNQIENNEQWASTDLSAEKNNSLEVLEMLKLVKEKKKGNKKSGNVKKVEKILKKTTKGTFRNNSLKEDLLDSNENHSWSMTKRKKFYDKLRQTLDENKPKKPIVSLRTKMMEKLKAARFRFLNEQIYKTNSKETEKIFKTDPDAFKAYHEGYQHQVKSWPLNPVNVIIKSIKKMPNWYKIADLGCGDAQIKKSVEQQVYSFDLVAVDESVTACDMANVPLENDAVNVAVFCLSLMGTNLNDYLLEANRVLKTGGELKIAEVESRFENVDEFIKNIQKFGFRNVWKDLSHNLFYFLNFTKVHNIKNKNKLPTLTLLPCLYKKR